jgi:hypothetical protein
MDSTVASFESVVVVRRLLWATVARSMVLTVPILVGGGCGGPAAVPLCDGSDRLTLRVFDEGSPGRDVIGSAVRIENGFPSFAVDGQCRYFIGGGWDAGDLTARNRGWREGTLDSSLRETLQRRAGVDDLSEIDCNPSSTLIDAGFRVIANSRSLVACRGVQPRRVQAVFDAIGPRLWEQGAPLEQGLHLTITMGIRDGSPLTPYVWPSGLELADYIETGSDALAGARSGISKLVAAADAAPLRALREQYLADAQSLQTYDGIPVTDGEVSGTMFMRDALPYENEQGLWPLPGD